EAVVSSLTRVAAAGPASLASLRLEPIVGYAELTAGDADGLAGVTAPDDATVRIQTVRPMATRPAIRAAPEMGIVPPAAVEALASADGLEELEPEDLVLSGSWEPRSVAGGALALDRRADAGAHLATVVLQPHDDPADAYDAFEAGDVDWALVPGPVHDDAV